MAGDNPEQALSGSPDEFLSAPPWRRILIVFAGPAANIITAIAGFLLLGMVLGSETLPFRTIHTVIAGSPADRAGLRSGDIIVAVRGEPVETYDDLLRQLAPAPNDTYPLRIPVTVERTDPVSGASRVHTSIEIEDVLSAHYDDYLRTPTIQVVQPNSPAAQAGLAAGDTILSVSGIPVSNAAQISKLVRSLVRKDEAGSLQPIPVPVTWAGPTGESTSAVILPRLHTVEEDGKPLYTFAQLGVGWNSDLRHLASGTLDIAHVGLTIQWPPVVGRVAWFSPAARLGIRPGDTLISVDGRMIRSMDEAIRAAWDAVDVSPSGTVTAREVEVSWRDRQGKIHQQRTRLDRDQVARSFESGEYTWRGSLGVEGYTPRRHLGVLGSVQYALQQTWFHTAQFGYFLKQMVVGAVNTKHLAGPVEIFRMSGKMGRRGWDKAIELIGLICINLALINLLPIPILDGGHIALYTIEAIRRKPWTLRQLEIATWIGLVPILLLFVLVFYNDLYRLFLDLRF